MSETIRVIIVMSVSGSILAALLFAVKPLMKARLPKAAGYYLWLVVIAALLVPVSLFIKLPATGQNINEFVNGINPAEMTLRIYDTVQRYAITTDEARTVLHEDGQFYDQYYDDIVEHSFFPAFERFMLIYPFGFAAAIVYHMLAYFLFLNKIRRHNVPTGIACQIPVFRNAKAATPMLTGLFEHSIILPDREYTDEQLHAVLLHELTHLRRRDVLVKWLSVLACSVHWFNPIVWLTRREIDRACELSCDEAVIRGLDANGRQSYGDTLLYTAAATKMPRAVLSTTMCEDKKNLKERLSAIMSSKKHTRAAVIVSAAVICAAALAALVLGAGSGQNIPEAMPAPDYDPNFEFVNMFEVQTQPDRYTPAMSSYPGIYIETNGQAVGGAIMRYECEMGTFATLEDGIITTLGNYVEREYGAFPNLHWSPISDDELSGDTIKISLIVDDSVEQETLLEIRHVDGWYSIVPIAED